MSFTLSPAIDIKEGRAVRLYQGELTSETNYGNPITAAQRFIDEGAQWLHVVDLDAAFGRGDNYSTIQSLAALSGINIEVSGGIRDDDSLNRVLSAGCRRITLGTAAIENPEWVAGVIEKFGDVIAISADVRGRQVATRGWQESAGEIFDLISFFDQAKCSRYIITDIDRDGTMTGPNVSLYSEVLSQTQSSVIASGGISSLADIRALTMVPGLSGAIIGKALYSNSFTLADAIAMTK